MVTKDVGLQKPVSSVRPPDKNVFIPQHSSDQPRRSDIINMSQVTLISVGYILVPAGPINCFHPIKCHPVAWHPEYYLNLL